MDLIDRSKVLADIEQLLKSPYAREPYGNVGAIRRDAIRIVRDLCVNGAKSVDLLEDDLK